MVVLASSKPAPNAPISMLVREVKDHVLVDEQLARTLGGNTGVGTESSVSAGVGWNEKKPGVLIFTSLSIKVPLSTSGPNGSRISELVELPPPLLSVSKAERPSISEACANGIVCDAGQDHWEVGLTHNLNTATNSGRIVRGGTCSREACETGSTPNFTTRLSSQSSLIGARQMRGNYPT